MKHLSITKNKNKRKRGTRRNNTNHNITHTQSGGVKVLIGRNPSNTAERSIEREVTTLEHFKRILDTATDLRVISSSSLNSFVIRIQLAPGREFFKSDMVGEDGNRLDFIQIVDATSGMEITEVIIKICIIGNASFPRDYILSNQSINKLGVTIDEFNNEYDTQRYLYSSMMSTSGTPYCPDAFGKLEVTSQANFNDLFGVIRGNIAQSNEFNRTFDYITDLLARRNHYVSLILMESVPRNYNLFTDYLPGQRLYVHRSFKELSDVIYAINIVTIYRGKLFLLDAHPNNWLCDPTAAILSKVKAIDFGRVYRIHNEQATMRFLDNTRSNVVRYFQRILCVAPQSLNKTISDFINMMCVSGEQRARILSQPHQSQFTEAANLLVENLQEVITIFNRELLFSNTFTKLTPEQRTTSIHLIHRLLLLLSLVDGFFNDTKFGPRELRRSQQYESYKQLYETDYSTPDRIIGSGILINFEFMSHHPKHSALTNTYEAVYNIVYEYCQDRFFPEIRGYTAFKKAERNIARQALLSLTPHAKVAKSKLYSTCSAVASGVADIGIGTGSFLLRNVVTPVYTYALYKPTMWALYSLNLKQRPPPPKRVYASSTGGRSRKIRKIKRSHKK
jgi:hypothetical protein